MEKIGFFAWLISQPSAAAILLSSTLAAMGTFFLIRHQRIITKRQLTIQMVMINLWDRDYIKSSKKFSNILKEKGRLEFIYKEYVKIQKMKISGKWGELSPNDKKPYKKVLATFDHVLATLNNYELIAIGIREGIYDEAIYRRWYRNTVVSHWWHTRVFIEMIRDKDTPGLNKKAFCEFCDLASRWDNLGPLNKKTRHMRYWRGKTYTIISSE